MPNRVMIETGEVTVDADPEQLADMVEKLIYDPDYRTNFESDPATHLGEVGVSIPPHVASTINRSSIDEALFRRTEGGGDMAMTAAEPGAVLPGVAVGVRVGTRPGTRPGVNVGVRVATGSSTFAVAQADETSTQT